MVNLKRPIAALLLATTPACMAATRVAPAQYLSQHQPSQMLVKGNDGTVMVIQNPEMRGEDVVGLEFGTPDTISVPVSQVSEALVKVKSPGRTAILVGGMTILGAVTIVGFAVAKGGRGCEAKSSNPLVRNCPDSNGFVFDDT